MTGTDLAYHRNKSYEKLKEMKFKYEQIFK